MGKTYYIKFRFAGTGDFFWRKVSHVDKEHEPEHEAFKAKLARKIEEAENSWMEKYETRCRTSAKNANWQQIKKETKQTLKNEALKKAADIEKKYTWEKYKEEVENAGGFVRTQLTESLALNNEFMQAKYGKRIGKNYLWERTIPNKHGQEQITFTLAGPNVLNSNRTIGQNFQTALECLESKIDEILKSEDTKEVFVMIKGHSRGGVAANRTIKYLSRKFSGNEKVSFVSTTFDPVPGTIPFSDNFLVKKFAGPITDEDKKLSMDKDIKSVVIYSVKTGYYAFGGETFQPQKIYNSKIVIISELNHAVGLYDVNKHEGEDENKGKAGKHEYRYEGQYYRPGKLHLLPDGTYWADKSFLLNKIVSENYYDYIKMINRRATEPKRSQFLKRLLIKRILGFDEDGKGTPSQAFLKLLEDIEDMSSEKKDISLLIKDIQLYFGDKELKVILKKCNEILTNKNNKNNIQNIQNAIDFIQDYMKNFKGTKKIKYLILNKIVMPLLKKILLKNVFAPYK